MQVAKLIRPCKRRHAGAHGHLDIEVQDGKPQLSPSVLFLLVSLRIISRVLRKTIDESCADEQSEQGPARINGPASGVADLLGHYHEGQRLEGEQGRSEGKGRLHEASFSSHHEFCGDGRLSFGGGKAAESHDHEELCQPAKIGSIGIQPIPLDLALENVEVDDWIHDIKQVEISLEIPLMVLPFARQQPSDGFARKVLGGTRGTKGEIARQREVGQASICSNVFKSGSQRGRF